MGGDEGWRVVRARVYLVMGLTTACLALYAAISLDPAPPFMRQQFQVSVPAGRYTRSISRL